MTLFCFVKCSFDSLTAVTKQLGQKVDFPEKVLATVTPEKLDGMLLFYKVDKGIIRKCNVKYENKVLCRKMKFV